MQAGNNQSIRVVIIDDHEIVVRGLTRILDLDGRVSVVGSASTLAEGRELCRVTQPDVIILDLKLPDSKDMSVVREFRKANPTAKLIVLTAFGGAVRNTALCLGADAFLTKEAASDKIVEVVCGTSAVPGKVQALSGQERKVAHCVAMGMSNEEVGRALCISTNTVKTHLRRLLPKLGFRDRIQLVREYRERSDDFKSDSEPTNPA